MVRVAFHIVGALVGALLLVLGLKAPASAKNIALVIGNGHYDTIQELANPNRDAIAMAGRLQDLGFQVTPVFDAGAGELNRLADTFIRSAKGADLALIYFAGHGVQLFDRNFLLGRDFDLHSAKRPEDLGLDLTGLVDRLKTSGAIRHAILVDACRSNPLDINGTVALLQQLSPANGAAAPSPRAGTRGLAPFALTKTQGEGSETLMFFAAQPGAVSLDGSGQNSFFVEGLKQALAKPNRPIGDVFRDASVYVRAATGGQQVPQVVSDWTSDPIIGAAVVARVEYEFLAKGDRDLSEGERRKIIAATEKGFRFKGDFAAHAIVGSLLSDEPEANLGEIQHLKIHYDLARSGREQTLEAYFHQTDYEFVIEDRGVRRTFRNCTVAQPADGNLGRATVEIALRDINGDGRPEVWVLRDDGSGAWGTFCILEFRGIQNMTQAVRANTGLEYGAFDTFRTLVRGNAGWGVTAANDNTIRVCGGSYCASEWVYTFDGTRFQLATNQPGKAEGSFADERERAANRFNDLRATASPVSAGAWALRAGSAGSPANLVTRLGNGSELTLQCAKNGDEGNITIAIKNKEAQVGRDDIQVDEVLGDAEVASVVPILADDARCRFDEILEERSKREIFFNFSPEASRSCLPAVGRARRLTLPLMFRETGLLQVAMPGASAALARWSSSCNRGASAAPESPPQADASQADDDARSRVERFVTDTYFADRTPNTAELEARYAATLQYFGKADVARSRVIREKLQYYRQWPNHRFRFTPGTLELSSMDGAAATYQAVFEYDFDLTGAGKHRTGHGKSRLVLRLDADRVTVVGEGGEVTRRGAER